MASGFDLIDLTGEFQTQSQVRQTRLSIARMTLVREC